MLGNKQKNIYIYTITDATLEKLMGKKSPREFALEFVYKQTRNSMHGDGGDASTSNYLRKLSSYDRTEALTVASPTSQQFKLFTAGGGSKQTRTFGQDVSNQVSHIA
jgi:hypothetical protein